MDQWTRADHPCGIFPDVPEALYHASDGLSQSQLKLLGEEGGPAKFRYGTRKETSPQKLGTLVHTLLLQPHTIAQRYHVTQLTREGTKAWEAEAIEAGDRIMVKQAEFDKARYMVDSVFRWSSVARELLSDQESVMVEQSLWWKDPESGLLMRARVDAAHSEYRVLLDLKTTVDASPAGFRRAVREYGYHVQNAMYQDGWMLAGGWEPVDFLIIAIQKDEPYLTGNYVLDKDDIQTGRDEIRRLIGIYQYCQEMQEWPGYDSGITTLSAFANKRRFHEREECN